ncbi:M28 family metallopeptidase [Saccharomonospora sp. NPDC046836]|uniref:M28 family metallopeptidase n=1 Tax=Saccharomonospora sp. NPDC046836 TaxID=3156921 RepID=UPI0034089A0D
MACAGLVLSSAATATAARKALPDELASKVDISQISRHLNKLQTIADSSDGNRAASTVGHERSAEYIASKLKAVGYTVTRQEFPFVYTETLAQELAVAGADVPINIMTYSPSTPEGGITAPLAVIESDDTPGCEVTDYGDVTGKIVLVERGICPFAQKQAVAAEAGAVGAIIYNNVEGPMNATLSDPDVGRIPTGGITRVDGEALAAQDGAEVALELRALQEDRTSYNVIAETKTGRKDNVVVAGAHVDGVTVGAGINDNGSGSAALLETALQLGAKPKVNNAVRFAWWSAEEYGLVGSRYYVNSLSAEQQLDIALYLNFDMIGSPNAGYFVYDGDDSDGVGAGPGPDGSAEIEQSFVDYLAGRGVETEGRDFDGRSDYAEFIAVGIPAGGVQTGADGIKTPEQAANWGGQAGVAYDSCYHQSCDDLDNVDLVALDRMADAMAWTVGKYALSTEDLNGVAPQAAKDDAQLAEQRNAQRQLVTADHGHDVTS